MTGFLFALGLCVSGLLATPAAAFEEEEVLRLKGRLGTEAGLSEEAWRPLEVEVREHLRQGRDPDEVSDLVRELHVEGCRGPCLAEALRASNRARAQGRSAPETRLLLGSELREQLRERDRTGAAWDDRELGNRLRLRVDDRLRPGADDRGRGRGRDHPEDGLHRSGSDHQRQGGDDRGGGRGRDHPEDGFHRSGGGHEGGGGGDGRRGRGRD